VEMSAQSQPRIEILLDEVVKKKASDLHLQVGLPPMLRIDGSLAPVNGSDPLDEESLEALVFAILDEDQKQILLKDKEFDFSFAYGELGRFRVNAFHERGNMAAAMRLIPNEILTIEQLRLPTIVNKFADFPRGLVLVTGPTGSGKSTTLASMVHKINTERSSHIITIEDPIEYTHRSLKSVIAQREVHYDTYSFSAALRSALREDPDVVLIGEMRDLETIASAITIAETGHLVLATLHTNSAAQSVDRMIDVFPPHQQPQIRAQLSNILMAIVSQRLIPAIGGGRIAAAEILIATSAVRNIIREGKSHQLEAVIQTGSEFGMQSMDKTLVSLIHEGSITYDEARNYAIDLDELDRLMRG
jgi:twitching motility protein PilT